MTDSEIHASVLAFYEDIYETGLAPRQTDRAARGRNNAAARRDTKSGVALAHSCAAERLGMPKLPRRLKKTLWRSDPEYFC